MERSVAFTALLNQSPAFAALDSRLGSRLITDLLARYGALSLWADTKRYLAEIGDLHAHALSLPPA